MNWAELMEILKTISVDWRDRRMISRLYMQQEEVVRLADGEAAPARIERRKWKIWLSRCLSPLNFKLIPVAQELQLHG